MRRSRTLRAAVVVAVVSLGALAAGSGPVVAQSGPDGDAGPGGGHYQFTDDDGRPLGEPVETEGGVDGGLGDGPPPTYEVDLFEGVQPEEGTFENEDACWGANVAQDGGGQTWAEVQATLTEYNDPQAWGVCAAEETFDLAAYVLQSWLATVRPPAPSPLAVAPGKAVTGLRSYLEIGGEVPATATLANPIGPDVVITMTPRYVVSWGDGASTGTTSQGVAYPGGPGEITHVYTDKGGVTVTVEAYWHGSWAAGGAGGDLPELPTPTEANLDLPVEERQVVVD